MTRHGIETLPAVVRSWLDDPRIDEVVLLGSGEAWVRFRDRSERRDPEWGARDPRAALSRLGEGATEEASVEIVATRRAAHRVARLIPRRDAGPDLTSLQREGLVLPEIRAAIEEAVRSHRGIVIASPTGRGGGPVFDAIVAAWRERGWALRLGFRPSADEVRAGRALAPDVLVLEYPESRAWGDLWMAPGPVLLHAHAPSAGRALRAIAAWTSASSPSLGLDVARELVVSHVDLVVEEESDGRARGAWRVTPHEVPSVEFVAGTKARLTDSMPPEPAPRRVGASADLPSPRAWSVPRDCGPDRADRFAHDDPITAGPEDDTPDLFGASGAQPHRSDLPENFDQASEREPSIEGDAPSREPTERSKA